MRWRIILSTLCAASLLALSSCGSQGGDENAIRKQGKAFDEAYNKHDSKGLSELWSEDGVWLDPETGEKAKGREEINQAYQKSFGDASDITIESSVDNITFPDKDSAVESGTATFRAKGQDPRKTAYKAYYRKDNGRWLLTQIRKVNLDAPPTSYEHLKVLEWLVGDWVDEDEDSKIETICKWDKYKNFLTQHFTVTLEGQVAIEGQQIITWDPIKKVIRSWVFDSHGAFGEGLWRQDGKSWVVEIAQTLASGQKASAINIYTPGGPDDYTFESTGREVGGVMMPNIPPVENKRKKG